MLITITGNAGSGKSTTAKAVAEKLGYEYISIGDMKRKLAEQMGINIIEFNELGERPENQREFDIKYEDYQKGLNTEDNILLESRLGFWCQPNSFKVLLSIDGKVAAQRIFAQSRDTDNYTSWEDLYEATNKRNQQDINRYQKLYGVNYQDPKNFDLIVDTTDKKLEQTVDIVIKSFYDFLSTHAKQDKSQNV